jgi:hypothetical protein
VILVDPRRGLLQVHQTCKAHSSEPTGRRRADPLTVRRGALDQANTPNLAVLVLDPRGSAVDHALRDRGGQVTRRLSRVVPDSNGAMIINSPSTGSVLVGQTAQDFAEHSKP